MRLHCRCRGNLVCAWTGRRGRGDRKDVWAVNTAHRLGGHPLLRTQWIKHSALCLLATRTHCSPFKRPTAGGRPDLRNLIGSNAPRCAYLQIANIAHRLSGHPWVRNSLPLLPSMLPALRRSAYQYMANLMAIAWTAAGQSCNVGISIPTLQDAVV